MPLEEVFEDVAPNGNKLRIERNIRCDKCNGCLVTEIDDMGLEYPNIITEEGHNICIDTDECEANIEAAQVNMNLHFAQDSEGEVEICGITYESPDGDITIEKE